MNVHHVSDAEGVGWNPMSISDLLNWFRWRFSATYHQMNCCLSNLGTTAPQTSTSSQQRSLTNQASGSWENDDNSNSNNDDDDDELPFQVIVNKHTDVRLLHSFYDIQEQERDVLSGHTGQRAGPEEQGKGVWRR
ncbi:hypothetical protein GN956_G2398 [Arapaima gigas]